MHAMGFNSVFAGDVCFCKAKQSKAKEVFDEGATSHAQSAEMRPLATVVAWSVFMSVGHHRGPYRNG